MTKFDKRMIRILFIYLVKIISKPDNISYNQLELDFKESIKLIDAWIERDEGK